MNISSKSEVIKKKLISHLYKQIKDSRQQQLYESQYSCGETHLERINNLPKVAIESFKLVLVLLCLL